MLLKDTEDMLRFALWGEGQNWRLAPGQLDLHVVVVAVEGLEAGLYHLHFSRDLDSDVVQWTPVKKGDFRHDLKGIALGQELASDCAFALFYTSNLHTLVETYGDRGYRYACLDAGQIGERLQLWSVHIDLGSSGLGGYYDDWGNEFLGLPLNHGLIYITVVGVSEE